VQTAQSDVIVYERQTGQARNALVLPVGQELPDDLPAARPFANHDLLAAIPKTGRPIWSSDALTFLLAGHVLKPANANIGAARAAFFPAITLTCSVGSTSVDLMKLFGPGAGQWN
jgi:multidrug efflux system outer membrane protein